MTYRGEERAPMRRTEINPSGTTGPVVLAVVALLIAAAFLFYNSGGQGPAAHGSASVRYRTDSSIQTAIVDPSLALKGWQRWGRRFAPARFA